MTEEQPTAPKVFAFFPGPQEFVEQAFGSIARDGAATIEVALTLRQALSALSASENERMAEAAAGFAETALLYSEQAGLLKHEMERLREISV